MRALCVKRSTNTCMVLAKTGQYPLTVDIQLNMVKLWIKILTCDKDQLIWIAYDSMLKGTDHVGTFMGLKCVVYYANYRSGNQSSKIQVVP